MKETWIDVKGYEGLYKVSNYGRVKSNRKILKNRNHTSGYLQVNLSKRGHSENKYIHRLVAEAFIDNPNNFSEVNHKDENKLNNRVDNLEWCSRQYNNTYGTKIKRTSENNYKKVLCVETNTTFNSIIEAAKTLNINAGNITLVCKGLRKTAGSYHWKYFNNEVM